MPKTLPESFAEFTCDRADVIHETIGGDAEYHRSYAEFAKLLKRIQGQGAKELIREIEDAVCGIEKAMVYYAYRRGMKEGAQLRQELGLSN